MSDKSRVFRSGLTRQASLLAAAPLLVAGLLLVEGASYFNKFPEAPLLTAVFSYLPILFGLGIVGFALHVASKHQGKVVTVTPTLISYEHGAEKFAVRWEMLAFAAPPPDKKMMRGLSISDGTNFTRIEELFFPEFDQLLEAIRTKKGRR